MPVRWRQYELLFVLIIFLFFTWDLAAHIFMPHGKSGVPAQGKSIATYYVWPFVLSGFIPVVLMILINAWLLPRYLYHRQQLLILTVSGVLGWLILCIAFAASY